MKHYAIHTQQDVVCYGPYGSAEARDEEVEKAMREVAPEYEDELLYADLNDDGTLYAYRMSLDESLSDDGDEEGDEEDE